MPVLHDGTPVDQTGKPRPIRKKRALIYCLALLILAAILGAPAYAGNLVK